MTTDTHPHEALRAQLIGSGISPNVATAPFTQTTLCPLGPSVVSPIASLHKYFREEIAARLVNVADEAVV